MNITVYDHKDRKVGVAGDLLTLKSLVLLVTYRQQMEVTKERIPMVNLNGRLGPLQFSRGLWEPCHEVFDKIENLGKEVTIR